MITTIIIFSLSFIILSVFMYMKVTKLRTENSFVVTDEEIGLHIDIPEPNFGKIKNITLSASKKYALWTALTVSKLWLIAIHNAKKSLKKKYPDFFKRFEKRGNQGSFSNSLFLRTITEYKIKMRRFKEHLKEHKEENF